MPEENKVMKPSCLNNMFNCDVSSKLCAFLYQRGGASLIVAKVLARSRRSLGSRKGYRFEAAQKARRRFFTSKKVFSTVGKFHCQIFPLRKNSYSTVSIIFFIVLRFQPPYSPNVRRTQKAPSIHQRLTIQFDMLCSVILRQIVKKIEKRDDSKFCSFRIYSFVRIVYTSKKKKR